MDLANGHVEEKVSDLDGKPPESTDYANYFCTYSFLYHQVLTRLCIRASMCTHVEILSKGSTASSLDLCILWQLHRAPHCCGGGSGRSTGQPLRGPPPRRAAQKDMLEDHKRTGAYYQAVMQNRRQFEGRTVLDVGTGSGILAIFAARAGARKVYAVEATAMAKFARQLVEHNKVWPPVPVPLLAVLACMRTWQLSWDGMRDVCGMSWVRRRLCQIPGRMWL